MRRVIIILLVILNLSAISYFLLQRITIKKDVIVLPKSTQFNKALSQNIDEGKLTVEKKYVSDGVEKGPDSGEIFSEVSIRFKDKAEIQKAWVSRAKNIVLRNKPEAGMANFRGSYFHRGFKDIAMTCGEVEFLNDGLVIEDFQRFISPGGFSTYFENSVQNFDILWDKLCVQVYQQ